MSSGSAGVCRLVSIGAIAVGALALAAAPVMAAKKPQKLGTAKASASATGAFAPVSAVATCPAGTRVVAGGYTTSAPSLPSHWLVVHESRRLSKDSWRVSGVQYFAGSDTLTVYAYCQALKAKVLARSARAEVPTPVDSGAVVQASCPKGTKAISGGFVGSPASADYAGYVSRSIGAGGNRWVVDATRLAGAGSGTLVANVYCAAVAKVKSRSASAAVVAPPGSLYTATTGKCPNKLTTGGGGFATSTPVGGLANAALVYETRLAGTGWSSSATPSSGTTSITLVTAAYCR